MCGLCCWYYHPTVQKNTQTHQRQRVQPRPAALDRLAVGPAARVEDSARRRYCLSAAAPEEDLLPMVELHQEAARVPGLAAAVRHHVVGFTRDMAADRALIKSNGSPATNPFRSSP